MRLVLGWESAGMNFGTNLRGPIFSSTAPPGTSQHLSLLAFDVTENGDPRVREILNRHGWHQTIVRDTPHFTFLGLPGSELPGRGLKAVYNGGRMYWVPDIPAVVLPPLPDVKPQNASPRGR